MHPESIGIQKNFNDVKHYSAFASTISYKILAKYFVNEVNAYLSFAIELPVKTEK
jgi:hypothetical protein